MTLDKPLSENALASVMRGMSITSKTEFALYEIEQELKRCKVTIDAESFENVRMYIGQLNSQLSKMPLASAEAALRGRK